MSMRSLRSLLAVLVAALAVAGCGGQKVSADEVPGAPVALTDPGGHQGRLRRPGRQRARPRRRAAELGGLPADADADRRHARPRRPAARPARPGPPRAAAPAARRAPRSSSRRSRATARTASRRAAATRSTTSARTTPAPAEPRQFRGSGASGSVLPTTSSGSPVSRSTIHLPARPRGGSRGRWRACEDDTSGAIARRLAAAGGPPRVGPRPSRARPHLPRLPAARHRLERLQRPPGGGARRARATRSICSARTASRSSSVGRRRRRLGRRRARVTARREPARATVYRPDIGGLLPVYVADRYDGDRGAAVPASSTTPSSSATSSATSPRCARSPSARGPTSRSPTTS